MILLKMISLNDDCSKDDYSNVDSLEDDNLSSSSKLFDEKVPSSRDQDEDNLEFQI